MPEIGQTISHYRIVEKIGQGGMGEVYLADDTILDRKVALKFLPEAFTSDPERMARFEREAKLLASLNHPNIAGIYGLEQADGNRFLVLEYVEGETLQARLSKGALPLEEALSLCRQIAEGLEAAHEKGVIHRDLKPANVMITAEQKVKILDFGLAKAFSEDTQSIDSSQSPTLTEAMTRPGVILGTAAYMSPEQAKGKSVDKRADIWAFGCILYECLTGKKAFVGETVTETLAAVIKEEPEWKILPQTIPQIILVLLRRCLQKAPHERLRDIGDILMELDTSVITGDIQGLVSSSRMTFLQRYSLQIIALLTITTIIALVAVFFLAERTSGPPPTQEVIASLLPNPGVMLSSNSRYDSIPALSPDGTRLVYPAFDEQGIRSLWLRSLDDIDSLPLSDTNWASFPFWSPDGKFIGFFADDQLKIIESTGGSARILCTNVANPYGASWNSSDTIILAANNTLLRVEASARECRDLNQESATLPMRPVFLDDGRKFLFFNLSGPGTDSVFVGDLETGKSTEIIPKAFNPLFLPPDRLLYMERNSAIYSTRFVPSSFQLISDAVHLLDNVAAPNAFGAYTAAGNALVAMQRVSPSTEIRWIDRKRQVRNAIEIGDQYWGGVSLSPDTRRLAYSGWGLRIQDIDSGVPQRVPAESSPGSQEPIENPKWSPNGDLLAYSSCVLTSGCGIRLFYPNEGRNEGILQEGSKSVPSFDWFPDGQSLAVVITGEPGPSRSKVFSVFTDGSENQPLFISRSLISELSLSPNNGQWVAYVSYETGPPEVYVRRIPGQVSAQKVSQNGGKNPHWSANGKTLFYVGLDNSIMGVEVQSSAGFSPSTPKTVVKAKPNSVIYLYAVSKDAQQFLVTDTPQPSSFILLLDYTKLLKK